MYNEFQKNLISECFTNYCDEETLGKALANFVRSQASDAQNILNLAMSVTENFDTDLSYDEQEDILVSDPNLAYIPDTPVILFDPDPSNGAATPLLCTTKQLLQGVFNSLKTGDTITITDAYGHDLNIDNCLSQLSDSVQSATVIGNIMQNIADGVKMDLTSLAASAAIFPAQLSAMAQSTIYAAKDIVQDAGLKTYDKLRGLVNIITQISSKNTSAASGDKVYLWDSSGAYSGLTPGQCFVQQVVKSIPSAFNAFVSVIRGATNVIAKGIKTIVGGIIKVGKAVVKSLTKYAADYKVINEDGEGFVDIPIHQGTFQNDQTFYSNLKNRLIQFEILSPTATNDQAEAWFLNECPEGSSILLHFGVGYFIIINGGPGNIVYRVHLRPTSPIEDNVFITLEHSGDVSTPYTLSHNLSTLHARMIDFKDSMSPKDTKYSNYKFVDSIRASAMRMTWLMWLMSEIDTTTNTHHLFSKLAFAALNSDQLIEVGAISSPADVFGPFHKDISHSPIVGDLTVYSSLLFMDSNIALDSNQPLSCWYTPAAQYKTSWNNLDLRKLFLYPADSDSPTLFFCWMYPPARAIKFDNEDFQFIPFFRRYSVEGPTATFGICTDADNLKKFTNILTAGVVIAVVIAAVAVTIKIAVSAKTLMAKTASAQFAAKQAAAANPTPENIRQYRKLSYKTKRINKLMSLFGIPNPEGSTSGSSILNNLDWRGNSDAELTNSENIQRIATLITG